MGQSKKAGLTGGQTMQTVTTNALRYYYMYGRRIILSGLMVAFAFFIGWFLHKEGYFPSVR